MIRSRTLSAPAPLVRLVGVLAVVVVAGGSALLGQAPAYACRCAASTTAEHATAADAVFTGTLVARRAEPSSAGQVAAPVLVVEVREVYQGAVEDQPVEVTTPAGSCGLGDLQTGRRYVVFADGSAAGLRAGRCGGTAAATTGLVGRVERLLGAGVPVPEPEPPTAQRQVVEESGPARPSRLAAPGAALALVGVLGLLVVGRWGRRAG